MKHTFLIFGIATLAFLGVGFSIHSAHATPFPVYHAEFWNVGDTPFDFDFSDPGTPVFTADYSGIYIPTNVKPDDSIDDQQVAGRFTKTTYLDVGTYSFLSRQDDGVRVYVSAASDETHEDEAHMLSLTNIGNGQDETGSWDIHGSDGNVWKGTQTIETAGNYKIIVEYSQNTGYYGMLFDYYKGTGTTDDPYLIMDCTDLQLMNIDVSGAYKLNNDIDCGETHYEAPASVPTRNIWIGGDGFWPIGDTFEGDSEYQGFYGSLDGNNKTISDLYIDRTDWQGVGLIGYGGYGVSVKDLTLTNENINGNTDVGGLFGEVDYGATITNVVAGGTIYADSSGWCGVGSAGGLIGYLYTTDGEDVSIADSSWGADGTSTITAYIDAGGIIGNIYVQDPTTSITIDNTSASFAVALESSPSNSQGGMIGYAEAEYGASIKVQNGSQATINFPEVSAYDIGGIAGYVDMGEDDNSSGNTFTINDTTTDGTIAATSNDLGGMVGYFYGADSVLSIENKSHSSVNISGGDDYIGGMVGDYYVLYTGKLKITDSSAGGNGAGVRGNDAIGGLVGYGAAEHGGSIEISGSSSDFSDENQLSSSNEWEPDMGGLIGYICHYTSSSMTIANSHTSINFATENEQDYYGGMVGGLCGGSSSTFTIDNSYADGSISSSNNGENSLYGFGGLIGWADFDSVSTVSISGSHSNVDINLSNADGDYYSNIGGLLGETSQNNSPVTINITDSYNTGTISTDNGENIGGLVGYAYMDDGGEGSLIDIENSYNTANMGGEWVEDAGGLVGYANYFPVSISDSYSIGNITGAEYLGGLIGSFGYEGNLSIADSYTTGNATGYKNDEYEGVGGILGWAGGSTTTSITHSYATGNMSGGDSVGGLVGVGYSDAISLDNTYAIGDVSGTRSVGGLVGYADIVDINHSYAVGDVTGDVTGLMWDEETPNIESETAGLVGELEGGSISNSFSAGKVSEISGLGEFTAGLIGEIDGTVGDGITLTNNYYDKTQSGQSNCAKAWDDESSVPFNVNGQCQAVTTNDYFINSSSRAPLDTWDFSSIWYKQGNDYPKFVKGRTSGGGSTGGGGGGSVSHITTTPITTPVTAPTDCKPGFMFSPSTGTSCAGVSNPSNTNSNIGGTHPFPGLLKYKSVGTGVLFLQQSLNKLGFTIALSGDGSLGHETTFFGLKTVAAVKAFQMSKGLMPDGMVGPMTWNAILTALGM